MVVLVFICIQPYWLAPHVVFEGGIGMIGRLLSSSPTATISPKLLPMPFNYDLLRHYARGGGLEQEESPAAELRFYIMVSKELLLVYTVNNFPAS